MTYFSSIIQYPELILASYCNAVLEGGSLIGGTSLSAGAGGDPDGLVLLWSTNNSLQRPEYRFHYQVCNICFCVCGVLSTFVIDSPLQLLSLNV